MKHTSPPTDDPQNEPPSYGLIAPYAPPVTSPPLASLDSSPFKGLPPGLGQLLQINQLTVKEKFSVSQGWGSSYDVLNHLGQRLFQANQSLLCCGPNYDVSIQDNSGNDVLQLLDNRACACTHEMWVNCPPGSPVGFVTVHTSHSVTYLSVMNSSYKVILLILGPSFTDSIFGSSTYEVKSPDEQHVVGIIKMETDHLLVSFPLDMEVAVKALLLGSSLYLSDLIKQKRRSLQQQAQSNS